MNKILNLCRKNYVLNYFNQKILPLYPDFKEIKKINIFTVKKNVWKTTYHVVIKFSTTFLTYDNQLVDLPIYCTAHSSEPRKNSYEALGFLWGKNFSQGDLVVPHPLFFSDDFNGYFYRGVRGQTLYYYISRNNYKIIEDVVAKAAAWFSKLHSLSTAGVKNFNPENSRIETVVPGLTKILNKIELAHPRYFNVVKEIYEIIIQNEKKYFSNDHKKYLIHGDAHPRNVVRMSENKIAVIDFTDMCLGDFTRDLGSFLQQLDFMASKIISDRIYLEKIKRIFLDNYLLNPRLTFDGCAQQRINNYYNWTALRTATFFMLKDKPEPERTHGLLIKICENLKLKTIV